MIKLNRLDGSPFVLNAELIRTIESMPDTLITLVSGEKIWTADSVDQVIQKTIHYRQSLIGRGKQGPWTGHPSLERF